MFCDINNSQETVYLLYTCWRHGAPHNAQLYISAISLEPYTMKVHMLQLSMTFTRLLKCLNHIVELHYYPLRMNKDVCNDYLLSGQSSSMCEYRAVSTKTGYLTQ